MISCGLPYMKLGQVRACCNMRPASRPCRFAPTNADANGIAIRASIGSEGSLVETCDVVESALAKKLISPPPNELLAADISNEVASIFRFKGTRDRSENLVTPSAPCADEVSPLRSRIGICEHIRNNLCEMNTYTKKGEGWHPPNTLVGPRFHHYSSCTDTHFDRAAARILVAQVIPPMPSARARLNQRPAGDLRFSLRYVFATGRGNRGFC